MSEEALKDSVPAGDGEPRHHLCADKPTIKILLYTDAPNVFTLEDTKFHGLALMLEHLRGHAPTFADVCIRWVSRYPTGNPQDVKKINVVLQEELCETEKAFDEIWFFGLHQGSKQRFSLGLLPGGPDSDLDEREVSALADWMSASANPGGGVLMTGDHSEEHSTEAFFTNRNELCPDSPAAETFFGLGRALGRRVPRAGRLRIWEGGPTKRPLDSHNTIQSAGLQGDPHPQELLLKWFDEKGRPSQSGQPHPLFFYKHGSRIEVFPDHQHEGAVVVPKIDPKDKEWPKGNCLRPLPLAVACGVNKRNCEIINLVAAYNGDPANVGRIVADSTWHHYVSMNLVSFTHPAPVNSPGDQIGQYYGNLSVWLSPRSKRREMAEAMFWWLATHPMMLEEVRGDSLSVGRAAYTILLPVASPCEIHELLLAIVPDRICEKFETLYFPEKDFVLSELPSKELIIGSVLKEYYKEMVKLETSDGPHELRTVAQVTDSGFEAALKSQREQIALTASAAKELA
jgi:hypothetical protein